VDRWGNQVVDKWGEEVTRDPLGNMHAGDSPFKIKDDEPLYRENSPGRIPTNETLYRKDYPLGFKRWND
jgi:hypothetical protein